MTEFWKFRMDAMNYFTNSHFSKIPCNFSYFKQVTGITFLFIALLTWCALFRLSLTGSATECTATIANISPEDAGRWRCMLADQTDYATVSRTLELGVGLAGVIGWAEGGSSGRQGGGGRLTVKENEEVELACTSMKAYPAPQLTIEGSDSLTRGREVRGTKN